MIMNGQIKQRRRGVWLFTSMGNFSHHGQTVEMGAKNVSQRYGKFHQLFIKKKKNQPLSFFNSNYCILELIITGNNEKSKTASEKKLEISLSVS